VKRVVLTVPSASLALAVPGTSRRVPLAAPSAAVSLAVPGTSRSTALRAAAPTLSLQAGSFVAGTPSGPMPRLLSCHVEAFAGMTRCSITDGVWSHLGKIRYSVRDENTQERKGITTYSPSSAAYSYAAVKNCTGLTIGAFYTLWYWLDCTPDIVGYVEDWYSCGFGWYQPAGDGDDFNYDFSQA
jgi:hypothetical protein